MTNREIIEQYTPLWGSWHVDSEIGAGNYGSVYKIFKEDFKRYEAALKLIQIPREKSEISNITSYGVDETHIDDFLEDTLKRMTKEIELMYELKGNSNIVSYEEHIIKKKVNEPGYNILIKMELLETLSDYLKKNPIREKDLIKLGVDICSALESCEAHNIIHRDIKEGNIFVSKLGNFKLGDFGIAKETSVSGLAMTKQGTPIYMAPEVFRGEAYTKQVDIYLLGMVLYKLANHNRMPFWPDRPHHIKNADIEKALEKRLSGADLPLPNVVSEELGQIINKACAFSPVDRYSSATELKESLLNYSKGKDLDRLLFDLNPSELPKKEKELSETLFNDDTGSTNEEIENLEPDLLKTVSLENVQTNQEQKVEEDVVVLPPEKPPVVEAKIEKPDKKLPRKKMTIKKNLSFAIVALFIIAVGIGAVKMNMDKPIASEDSHYNQSFVSTGEMAEEVVEKETIEKEIVEEEIVEEEIVEEEVVEEEVVEEEVVEEEVAEEEVVKEATPSARPAVTHVNVSSISLSQRQLDLFIGNEKEISATIAPNNATDKRVVWNSDNPSVATVDDRGKVTAVGLGEANITATSSNKAVYSVVKVKVESEGLTFGNRTIENAVRKQINKPTGPITQEDADRILRLSIANQDLTSLSGLEHLKNVRNLNLSNNSISDISTLAQLTMLTQIDIKNNNVVNLSPLNSLPNLRVLYISGNPYSDLSPIDSLIEQLERKDF